MLQRKLILNFAILLFLSLLLFTFFRLGIFNFASSTIQNIFAPLEIAARKIFVSEQSLLKKQNLDLAKKLVDQQKLIEDNKALRNQFDTAIINTQNLMPANIVGSPSFIPGISNPESLVLDKGKKDGVKKGQAIAYKDNLIGVVEKTGDNYSKILLVSSPSFSLTAKTLQDKALGTIKGQGAGQIILENVLLSQKLSKNDLVITSGNVNEEGFGVYPNLILGKIITINKNASSLFQSAKVQPLIDVSELSTLFIVVNP